jgi:hypothetical protein
MLALKRALQRRKSCFVNSDPKKLVSSSRTSYVEFNDRAPWQRGIEIS